MKIALVTLFPEMFDALLHYGVSGRAVRLGLIEVQLLNPRSHTTDRHQTVDDRPYGGGPGMLMMADPIVKSIKAAKKRQDELGFRDSKVIHMTPRGKTLNHNLVESLVKEGNLIFIASRYEGIDERVDTFIDEEISVGDFVTSGGELPTMMLMDCMVRQLPGVLNDAESAIQDSFVNGLLDHPHFTRPEIYNSIKVPEILISGDHEKIRIWRLKESLRITWMKRPDLLAERLLTKEETRLLEEIKSEQEQDSL